MSEDNKNDDWGMTIPNVRLDEEKKQREAAENFAPKVDAPPSVPPVDDWGMTQANVKLPQNIAPPQNQAPSQPYSDFDKTAPNIDLPPQYSEKPVQSSPNPPADDWGITQTNIGLPKDDKKEDWNMPSPVFRISSGETPSFDKTTPNINLRNRGEDFDSPFEDNFGSGNTTPYYRLSENQAESSPVAEPTAPVSEPLAQEEPEAKPVEKAKSGNMKWIMLLGGLFVFFLVVIASLVGVYYLFLDTPGGKVTSDPAANRSTETTTTPAPTSTTTVPTTSNLPSSISYKGDMVLVLAGEFTMGSDTDADESKPAHKITLPAFYIDKYEVTNAQYKEFCTAQGKTPPPDPFWEKGYFENRPNAPVLGVSFDDAKAYANWAGKRLPTETEWEKAASWSEATQSKFEFPWGNAFVKGNAAFGLRTTSDVGKFSGGVSPSGAMDMAGNVTEWVDSFFQPYPNSPAANPNFGETNRVVRGGHFGLKTNENLKTTKRIYVPPTVASGEDEEKLFAAAIGFRCAVSADDARLQSSLGK